MPDALRTMMIGALELGDEEFESLKNALLPEVGDPAVRGVSEIHPLSIWTGLTGSQGIAAWHHWGWKRG